MWAKLTLKQYHEVFVTVQQLVAGFLPAAERAKPRLKPDWQTGVAAGARTPRRLKLARTWGLEAWGCWISPVHPACWTVLPMWRRGKSGHTGSLMHTTAGSRTLDGVMATWGSSGVLLGFRTIHSHKHDVKLLNCNELNYCAQSGAEPFIDCNWIMLHYQTLYSYEHVQMCRLELETELSERSCRQMLIWDRRLFLFSSSFSWRY